VIAEIKRRSPSRGEIDSIFDPVARARLYQSKGIRTVSILTEEDHFSGSLTDLMEVKAALPSMAVLRKDFLLNEDDIEVSYRAGADAVLLIASILEPENLERLYRRTTELGMTALVELHSAEDTRKAEPLQPMYTGINSRDLSSFRVDPAHPIKMRSRITWPAEVVYESGIRDHETALLPGRSGFAGILVGEAAVRSPEQIPELIEGFEAGRSENSGSPATAAQGKGFFWDALFRRRKMGETQTPLIKVCGLTRSEDAAAADEAGADILGFILASVSPRATTPDFIRSIGPTRALKVAVVVGLDSELMLEIRRMLQEGVLDAVQFHGNEPPEDCAGAAYPYYKALPLRELADIDAIDRYHCPRVLVDAYHNGASGGTGRRIDDELVEAAAARHPLWLAGGLNPDNIAALVRRYRPELVDASSGLETAPGIKDHELILRFIRRVRTAESQPGSPTGPSSPEENPRRTGIEAAP
jgi:indole-3-glycerol phosphate synthase/phosphoribosylanthranilate isomerase